MQKLFRLSLLLFATSLGCGDNSAGKDNESCPTGLTDCNGVCVDTRYDPDNCGTCSSSCDAEMMCSQGSCGFECVGGTIECGAVCVDASLDEDNCGACGVTCDADEMCSDGTCFQCEGDMEECNDLCVDLTGDVNNCGGCGIVCDTGESCLQSACVGITPVGAFTTTSYNGSVGRDLFIAYDIDATSNTETINTVTFGGNTVTEFEILDNGHIVFLGAQDTEGVLELYLVPVGSGPPVKLSGALIATASILDFVVSDDQTRFLYRAEGDTAGLVELYGGSLAMPGVVTKFSGAIAAGGIVYNGYVISSDNSRIAYRADHDATNETRIFSVLATLPGDATLVADDPLTTEAIREILLSSDGDSLVFLTGDSELFAVDLGAPAARVALDVEARTEDVYVVSNNRVLYLRSLNGKRELFYTDLSTPNVSVRINHDLPSQFDVQSDVHVTADGNRVFYRAPTGVDGYRRLVYVDIAQPGDETLVSDAISSASVLDFRVSSDGQIAAYLSSTEEGKGAGLLLNHATIDSPGSIVEFSPPPLHQFDQFGISSDGSKLMYSTFANYEEPALFIVAASTPELRTKVTTELATYRPRVVPNSIVVNSSNDKTYFIGNYEEEFVFEIYEAEAGLPNTITTISPPQSSDSIGSFKLSPDDAYIVYSAYDSTAAESALFLIDLSNPGLATKISPPMDPFGDIRDYQMTSDGVFFTANPTGDDTYNLYSVLFASPTQFVQHTDLPAGQGVRSFSSHPSGSTIAYSSDQDTVDVFGVYLIDLSSPNVTTRVTQIGESIQSNSIKIGPDDTSVFYVRSGVLRMVAFDSLNTEIAVSITPVNGSVISNNYTISPDGSLVFYRGDLTTDNKNELYMSTLTIPIVSTKLNAEIGGGSDVFDFQLTPDSASIVFKADVTNGRNLLYIVDLAFPGVQTLLSLSSNTSSKDVFEYQVYESGVVYRGDLVNSSRNELFASEFVSPGTGTTLVSLTGSADVDTFRFSGSSLFYLADPVGINVNEILHLDISTPDVKTTLTPFPDASGLSDFGLF